MQLERSYGYDSPTFPPQIQSKRGNYASRLRGDRGGGAAKRFYAQFQVPDTPLGRYEMLSLHIFLALHRMRGENRALADLAQEIADEFFKDVDHSLRELGIGDQGVPKRMKKLARMFYGRVAAYGGRSTQMMAMRWRRP